MTYKIFYITLILLFISNSPIKANEHNKAYNNGLVHLQKAKQILIVGDSAFAYNYRATSNAKAKVEYEKAVIDFNESIILDSTKKETFNKLGFCYDNLGKTKLSLTAYQQALDLDSNYAEVLFATGKIFLEIDSLAKTTIQLTRLTNLKSVYSDSLAYAIKKFRLRQLQNKIQKQ